MKTIKGRFPSREETVCFGEVDLVWVWGRGDWRLFKAKMIGYDSEWAPIQKPPPPKLSPRECWCGAKTVVGVFVDDIVVKMCVQCPDATCGIRGPQRDTRERAISV